jgi:hypothetical protein
MTESGEIRGGNLADRPPKERGAILDRIIHNTRWLIENGLLRHSRGPQVVRIHPRQLESPMATLQNLTSPMTNREAHQSGPVGIRSPRLTVAWSWLLLAILTLLTAAYMFRYERIPAPDSVMLWDRWTHRICFASFGGMVCAPSARAPGAR